MRLFNSLSTGLNDARAILSRGVGAVWSRRPGNLKADEIAEEDWLQENDAAGDAQLFDQSDEPSSSLERRGVSTGGHGGGGGLEQ